VLVDTGIDAPGALDQLQAALADCGLTLDALELLICTHGHPDHIGLAAAIAERTGCEVWIHPATDHLRALVGTPAPEAARRAALAVSSGVTPSTLRDYRAWLAVRDWGVTRIPEPDRDLVLGVEIETDLGVWRVRETPGHAPSHVCLHQPDRALLLSGDLLLPDAEPIFDHGHTPDAVGELLASLDEIGGLDVRLALPGHGSPFADVGGVAGAVRDLVRRRLHAVRTALEARRAQTVAEVYARVHRADLWFPQEEWRWIGMLALLEHLWCVGDAVFDDQTPVRWTRRD
jgi:glyoxylase-like metal-dependent hydrolase (beta-lactamase superfamily II)